MFSLVLDLREFCNTLGGGSMSDKAGGRGCGMFRHTPACHFGGTKFMRGNCGGTVGGLCFTISQLNRQVFAHTYSEFIFPSQVLVQQ